MAMVWLAESKCEINICLYTAIFNGQTTPKTNDELAVKKGPSKAEKT